jgi:hypothetical protein
VEGGAAIFPGSREFLFSALHPFRLFGINQRLEKQFPGRETGKETRADREFKPSEQGKPATPSLLIVVPPSTRQVRIMIGNCGDFCGGLRNVTCGSG